MYKPPLILLNVYIWLILRNFVVEEVNEQATSKHWIWCSKIFVDSFQSHLKEVDIRLEFFQHQEKSHHKLVWK